MENAYLYNLAAKFVIAEPQRRRSGGFVSVREVLASGYYDWLRTSLLSSGDK